MEDEVKVFYRDVKPTQANYSVKVIKYGGSQASYNIPNDDRNGVGFFTYMCNEKLLIENSDLKTELLKDKYENHKLFTLSDEVIFELGPGVLWLIGDEYKEYDNCFVVSQSYDRNKKKWNKPQMVKGIYKALFENKLLNYKWFVDLYEKNHTGNKLIFKVDKNKLIFDIDFNSLKYYGSSYENENKTNTKYNKFKYNRILFGAPGTGKSYILNKEKEGLLNGNDENYERVTFHPDYSYANFVGTYKPVPIGKDITYKFVEGPFMRILVKALNKSEENFLLIIEEINRANVAAVFGDIFQLLDRVKDKTNDYGKSEFPINVSEEIKEYLDNKLDKKSNTNTLYIPSNMYIWATMNSADQGVYMMDTAFKRRWNFEYVPIDNEIISNLEFIKDGKRFNWNNIRKAINDKLLSYGINEDKLLGPFFIPTEYLYDSNYLDGLKRDELKDSEEFLDIFKNKVLMYLFEDVLKTRGRNELFSGVSTNKLLFSTLQTEFENKGLDIFSSDIADKFKNEDDTI